MLFVLHHHTADGRPRQVFVSYAHEDEAWKDRVVEALRPLETQRRIAAWHDRKLVPSEDWARTIDARLAESDVFLLLVSPDFVASAYCRETEVPRAVQRCEAGEAVLVPIILRDCPWQNEAFARFQAYPLDGTPLEAAADPQVFVDLREKMHLALLGWWYPRRPRSGTGPHALWQFDYRRPAGTEPPSPAMLVERLRALTEEPDIESAGRVEAQFVGGAARPTPPSLLLDGPAGAFAKLEALHGDGRLSAALGVEVVGLRIVLGAAIQARSGPATDADLLEAHEQLVLSAGSREIPDLPQVLMLRDDDPDWRMILPARGTEGATPKALFPEMRALFTEYFNTILAAPDGRLTVNLSTYQPDDILHPALRRTRLGRDLVEQDCRLKQFAVSLLHPDTPTGAAYWRGLRERATALGLDAGAEMAAYQKVWIVTGDAALGGKDPHQPLGNPGLATLGVRETDRGVWIERCDLKVMCEADYLAMEHHQGASLAEGAGPLSDASAALFREIVVPVLTEEVNQGAWFATLRQIYHAFVLAVWVRREVSHLPAFASLAERLDCGSPEAFGVVRDDIWAASTAEIYARYLALFDQGVFRCARPGQDGRANVYFAGGVELTDDRTVRGVAIARWGRGKRNTTLRGLGSERGAVSRGVGWQLPYAAAHTARYLLPALPHSPGHDLR